MKRIISLVLVIGMILSMVAVNAETKTQVLLNESYIDTPSNSLPETLESKSDGSVLYVTEKGANKVLAVKSRWSDTVVREKVAVSGGEVWVDMGSMFCDLNADKNILEIEGSQSVALIKMSASGVVRDYHDNMLCTVQKDTWNRFLVKVNLDTYRYDIYVNNIMRAERVTIPKISSIKSVGFTVYKSEEAESLMYNNYIRVNRGEEPVKGIDVTAATWNYTKEELEVTEPEKPEIKPTLYYNETFEETSKGARPENITASAGTQKVQVEENGNHYYSAEFGLGKALIINFEAAKIGVPKLPNSFVMQMDVKIGKNTDKVALFSFRDSASPYHYSRVAYINPNGSITTHTGTVLGSVSCRNEWVNVAVISNFEKHTHDYYINGELIESGVNFQDMGTINSMSMFRCESMTNTAPGGIQLDNLRIYSGNRIMSGDEFVTTEPIIPEKLEVWEHEITPVNLNIDLSKYTELPEYISKNPSSFLRDHHSAKETFDGAVCFVANNNNVWLEDKKYSYPNKIKWEDEHFLVPADVLASLRSEKVTYTPSLGTVTIGAEFSAKIGERKITVNGVDYETAVAVQLIDGVVYIPAKEYTIYKLKKYYSETYKGLAVIADKQMDLNRSSSVEDVVLMLGYLVLDLPNTEALEEAYSANRETNAHPRLVVTDKRMQEIIENAKTDEILAERLAYFRNLADTASASVFSYYVAYKMTGNKQYADKAEKVAVKLAREKTMPATDFDLWDAADMNSLALVYDLFYNTLSQETKDALADAMINKGLVFAQNMYMGVGSDWPNRKTNWNSVCNGGALIAAAILYGDGYADELCLDILEKGIVSLASQLHAYAPYGALFESIGYWEYGHGYLLTAIDALDNTFGTNFGIFNYPGLDTAAYFPVYLETNTDIWPLHDDELRKGLNNNYASWHAYKTHDLMLQKVRYEEMKSKNYAPTARDLVFYIPEPMPEKIDLPLDINYSYSELAVSRSDWEKSAFFLGVHAGANDFEHFQWDLGNFIYEAFGIRFAQDIGRDNYDLPNYLLNNTGKNIYYSHRTEGHNLYVINPDESAGQLWHAASEIEVLQNKPKGIIYSVDMTPAYYGQLQDARRGYMLTGGRRVLVVQDEIVPNKLDDLYKWFWTTEADIEITGDKTVTLTRNHKTVKLYFDSNVDFKLESGKTTPLKTSPNPDGQLKIGNMANKITATFKSEAEKVYFRCIAVPFGSEYEIGEIETIDSWNIPDGDVYSGYNNADMIYADGVPVSGFNPDVYDYTQFYVEYKGLPIVTAASAGKVTVTQADETYKTAVVKVTSESGVERIYTITFQSDIASGLPDGTEHKAVAVTAEDHDGNKPENIIDNNFNTRWTGKTTSRGWVELDLGEIKTVDAVALAVYSGNARAAFFDIQLSADGEDYITVVKDGKTTGTSQGYEYVTFEPQEARYVRLYGYGSSASVYNSYTELHAYKLN